MHSTQTIKKITTASTKKKKKRVVHATGCPPPLYTKLRATSRFFCFNFQIQICLVFYFLTFKRGIGHNERLCQRFSFSIPFHYIVAFSFLANNVTYTDVINKRAGFERANLSHLATVQHLTFPAHFLIASSSQTRKVVKNHGPCK